jgi:hypothetical protein
MMRRKLLWVVAAPFVVAALDFALMYLLVHLAHRGLDDTVYWGTLLPWLLQAVWVVAAIASLLIVLVGVLFVLPGWSVLRLLNRWPVHFGRELHGTPEQQVSRELRRPGI